MLLIQIACNDYDHFLFYIPADIRIRPMTILIILFPGNIAVRIKKKLAHPIGTETGVLNQSTKQFGFK